MNVAVQGDRGDNPAGDRDTPVQEREGGVTTEVGFLTGGPCAVARCV